MILKTFLMILNTLSLLDHFDISIWVEFHFKDVEYILILYI